MIQSPRRGNLCVDKIQSPPKHILCVPKTQSRKSGGKRKICGCVEIQLGRNLGRPEDLRRSRLGRHSSAGEPNCVDMIQSPRRGNLCVDKIQSPPKHILCVPKTQSRKSGGKRKICGCVEIQLGRNLGRPEDLRRSRLGRHSPAGEPNWAACTGSCLHSQKES